MSRSLAADPVVERLNLAFFQKHPREAAHRIELLPVDESASMLVPLHPRILARLWVHLAPSTAEKLAPLMGTTLLVQLLEELPVGPAATLLAGLDHQLRTEVLESCAPGVARELKELLEYPPDTAGRLMDTRLIAFNENLPVGDVLQSLQARGVESVSYLYLLDDHQHLVGEVDIHRLILVDRTRRISALKTPVHAKVMPMDHRDDVVARLEEYRLEALPVVDMENHLVGVIHGRGLLEVMQEDIVSDMQAMVGVSRDERARSSSLFAVKKRLPWLCVNVFTAFLAASVVGLFEGTIAQFTALAILMPVAAGQSGNTGHQALAVTMRGLTLREITTRDWLRMLTKEVGVGVINGIAIALLCGTAVYLWSQSFGLALVMGLAMVVSMIIACIAGTLIPIILKRLGADPATSSSIFLTTMTDVAGFMSFLGIATLLSFMLVAS